METSERIKKLGNYFKTMKIESSDDGETVIFIAVSFPSNWLLDQNTKERFDVNTVEQGGLIYFYTGIENGESKVFDAIEYNIEQNITAEEKLKLYGEMANKLRTLFEDEENTLDKLKTLSFVFKNEISVSISENNKTSVTVIPPITNTTEVKETKRGRKSNE